MKKTLVLILCIILTICILASCSQKQTVSAGGFDFDVVEAKTQQTVASTPAVSAGDGNTLLIINISVPSSTDPSVITETFMSSEGKSTANGTECKAVTMLDEGTGSNTYYIIYEVPATSEKTEYTVSGNSFSSFNVKA